MNSNLLLKLKKICLNTVLMPLITAVCIQEKLLAISMRLLLKRGYYSRKTFLHCNVYNFISKRFYKNFQKTRFSKSWFSGSWFSQSSSSILVDSSSICPSPDWLSHFLETALNHATLVITSDDYMYSLNHSIYQNWSSVSNCLILKGILIHLNCNQLLGNQLGEKVNLCQFFIHRDLPMSCLTLMNNFAWFRKQFKIWKMSCCCKWRDKTKISWISKIYLPSLEIWDSHFFQI